jgi:hypothetical protein
MRISSFIFLSMVMVLYSSCELLFPKTEEPKTELEKLPPITQEGKNTFGCLVNGRAIVITNSMLITAIFQQGNLQLGGGIRKINSDVEMTIFQNDPIEESITYDISKSAQYYNFNEGCYYELDNTYDGHIFFKN